jgi:hypothetical protein
MSNKGTRFERKMCKLLSLWWTNNQRDDVFWRTSGSGARAKSRSKRNQSTFGQYGDIQATDPIAQPLMNVCTIELKKGYPAHTFANLIEVSTHHTPKPGEFEKFILQAVQDSRNAQTPEWLLIVQRDRREGLVLMPMSFYVRLKEQKKYIFSGCPKIKITCDIKSYRKKMYLFGISLNTFLKRVRPKIIKGIYEDILETEGETIR